MKVLAWVLALAIFMVINIYAVIDRKGWLQMGAFLFLGVAATIIEKKLFPTKNKSARQGCECSNAEVGVKYKFKGETICSKCAERMRRKINMSSLFMILLAAAMFIGFGSYLLFDYLENGCLTKSEKGILPIATAIPAIVIVRVLRFRNKEYPKKMYRRKSLARSVQDVSVNTFQRDEIGRKE